MKIRVIDSIMGTGKTSYAIQEINNNIFSRSYIYVTPFLSEVDRIKDSCKDFYTPEGKHKQKHLQELIAQNCNIATTHAMFQHLTPHTLALIKAKNYHLILDEVITVIEQEPVSPLDLKALLQLNILSKNNNGDIIRGDENIINDYYDNEHDEYFKYNNIIIGLKRKSLEVFEGKFFMFLFPIDVFNAFKESTLLTYMFDGYPIKGYFDVNNIEYTMYSIEGEYNLIPYKKSSVVCYKDLIHIVDNKINDIGQEHTAFSKQWLAKLDSDQIQKIRRACSNFCNNILNTSIKDIMWTTFKEEALKVSTKYLTYATKTPNFVVHNMRATNQYKDKVTCIYLCNRFFDPVIVRWFKSKNIEINEDVYALSEFLQWLFRSAIRDKKDIDVFIPSMRIRNLIVDFFSQEL